MSMSELMLNGDSEKTSKVYCTSDGISRIKERRFVLAPNFSEAYMRDVSYKGSVGTTLAYMDFISLWLKIIEYDHGNIHY